MKKLCLILAAALLFALGVSAWAEEGVQVEVMKADGVSVVVLTPEETVRRARSMAMNAGDASRADFTLPQSLTLIEESAFEGIAAEIVEVSAQVVAIEARAFADCKALPEIHIPSTVLKVDDHALDGCENVTVYGEKGTEAERFAKAAGFEFVDPNAGQETPQQKERPAELPLVPRR